MDRATKAEVPILQSHHNVIEPRPSSLRDEEFNWYKWITKVGQLVIKQTRYNVTTPTLNTPTVITPTLITPTIITPILNTSRVTDSLCNDGAFSNPNADRDCPFNLKGAWFLSQSRKLFSYAALLFLKLFSVTQQHIFYKRKYYFM